jgi:uncharacterized protein (TIGR03437 family)
MANGSIELPIEYAGAAPGLLSGVIQINVKLPDSIPTSPNIPRGTLSLYVQTNGALDPVSIFVSE